MTIGVRDLASGKSETSRVKELGFVNGFRFLRFGGYATDGDPVWFKDVKLEAE